MRPRPLANPRNQLLHLMERMLRHPACALACAAGVAGLAFVLVSARALPLLGGILATLAIGCVGPWIAITGVTATVTWDRRRGRVGDPIAATITRRSLLPWWRPQLSVRWPAGEQVVTAMAESAADGRTERIVVVPHRRGRFPSSVPAIESDQPFGVVTARRAIAMPEQVIVWPASAVVQMPAGLVATAGTGRETSERITGHSGDAIGARDYRSGDSMRSIHWAHTARRDALVVRERPGTAAPAVRLVIDHRTQPAGQTAGEAARDRTLDALVGIAFAIIESWLVRGVTLEISWPGREACSPRTPAEVTRMLDELACLEPMPPANTPAPVVRGQTAAVDLEILLTTPQGKDTIAAAIGGPAAHPRMKRLWIVVGHHASLPGLPTGRDWRELVLHVAPEPDPIAALDALLAAASHDPDTRRAPAAGATR